MVSPAFIGSPWYTIDYRKPKKAKEIIDVCVKHNVLAHDMDSYRGLYVDVYFYNNWYYIIVDARGPGFTYSGGNVYLYYKEVNLSDIVEKIVHCYD